MKEIEVQTDVSGIEACGDSELEVLKKEVGLLKLKIEKRKFCLANIKCDDSKISFYTGFPKAEFNKNCRLIALYPKDDFLLLVRLRLGLMEQDLADRFEI